MWYLGSWVYLQVLVTWNFIIYIYVCIVWVAKNIYTRRTVAHFIDTYVYVYVYVLYEIFRKFIDTIIYW